MSKKDDIARLGPLSDAIAEFAKHRRYPDAPSFTVEQENAAMASVKNLKALDVTAPLLVEVRIRADGRVLWVNVNGKCLLRCCQVGILTLEDEREELKS